MSETNREGSNPSDPFEFAIHGEPATAAELQALEELASEFALGGEEEYIHHHYCKNPNTGDAIIFRTLVEQGGEEPGSYAMFGVAKGDTDNEIFDLVYDPYDIPKNANDLDDDDFESVKEIVREFLEGDLLTDAERTVVNYIALLLDGHDAIELSQQAISAGGVTLSVPERIRAVVDKASTYTIRTRAHDWLVSDDRILSVIATDVIEGQVHDWEEVIQPIQITFEDRPARVRYTYRREWSQEQLLIIEDLDDTDSEDDIVVSSELQDIGMIFELLEDTLPRKAQIQTISELLATGCAKIASYEAPLNRVIMNRVCTEGPRLLIEEAGKREDASEYIRDLVGMYHQTQLFDNMVELAKLFGMFEVPDDPDHAGLALDAMLKGMLLGIRVADSLFDDEMKEHIDDVNFFELTIGDEGEGDIDPSSVDTEAAADNGDEYFVKATSFHQFFSMHEDALCPRPHFQKYLKRGFGLTISLMEKAAQGYAEFVQLESEEEMKRLDRNEIDLNEEFRLMEAFANSGGQTGLPD